MSPISVLPGLPDPRVAAKGYAHADRLVSTEWLAAHLDHPTLRLLECNEDVLLYSVEHIPGAQQLAMARKLKNMVKVQGEDQAIAQIAQEMLESAVAGGGGGRGGFPGMPGGFPGMPGGMGGFPGMGDPNALMQALMGGGMPGMPGMPGAGAPKPRPASLGVPKDKRKQERDARRKNRKK